jgi:hypothetical protein
VVTAPLGVLKAGKIAFSPALSAAKQSAIKNVGFGVLDKVSLPACHCLPLSACACAEAEPSRGASRAPVWRARCLAAIEASRGC